MNGTNNYTAKQLTELLQSDNPEINLRTVRYYTQIGMIPPLELAGNKRIYTDNHLHYFRAIFTLARTGETLASIQQKLKSLSMNEIRKIGDKLPIVQSNLVLDNETLQVSKDVYITVSPRISPQLKQRMIDTVARLIEGDSSND